MPLPVSQRDDGPPRGPWTYLLRYRRPIVGGVPFVPSVVLWINFLVQVPVAVALGFDKPAQG